MVNIKDLWAGYDHTPILKGISLDIKQGDIVGILGPNGSGKTTLALTLLGFTNIIKGYITIDEKPFSPKLGTTYISLLMQVPDNMLFARTVYEEVALAPYKNHIRGEKLKETVKTLLREVGMLHKIDSPIHSLSYGEKKKVAMAVLMSMNKPYIILDEPFAGLDLSGRKDMKRIIKKMKSNGKGIMLISHDVYSLTLADKVFVLHDGTIVKSFFKEEFKNILPELPQWNLWVAGREL